MPYNPDLEPLFEQAGQQYNVDPAILKAIHLTETGGTGRWDQVSPAGAKGGMQFIPSTAKMYGVTDPTDPAQAIPGAAHLISDLLNTYEKQVGPGPEALTMALRGYNGGGPSRWNNPETASYPGAVAKYYAQVSGPSGAGGGIRQLASAGGGDDGSPVAAGSASALLAAPVSMKGRLPDPQFDARMNLSTKYAAALDGGFKGTINDFAQQIDSGQPVASGPQGKPPMSDGISALAAAGQPQGAPQAAPGGMSDEELLNGFVNWSHPFLPKAPEPVTVPPPTAVGAPAAPAAPASGGQAVLGPEQVIQMLNTAGQAKGGIAAIPGLMSGIETMLKNGTQFVHQPDGTIGIGVIGGAPGATQTMKAAESAGSGTDVPSSITKTNNEEVQKRITAAVAPQSIEPGKQPYYPPGSPSAGIASQPNASPGGPLAAVPGPGGGTVITGAPPTASTTEFNKAIADLGTKADAARAEKWTAGLLQQKLKAIGTSGPLTESLGALSSLAQQAGVPPETLAKMKLPAGANVEAANTLALGLLGNALHAQFPQRITNTDITLFRPSSPNANMLNEATDFLINHKINPQADREIQRYGAAVNADLPQQTPMHLQRFLNQWDNDNPYDKFAPTAPPPKRGTYNPATGKIDLAP